MPYSLSERSRGALEDIRENARLCLEFTADMDFPTFAADKKTYYAAVRCLEIISEATRKLDTAILNRHQIIPWHLIRSSGNIYRHEYNDISESLVWGTITSGLAALLQACESELSI